MEIMQLPHFGKSPQPAETFFERKFGVNPMGVFDEVRGTGTTYLFSQNNGKTNSNHVASILQHHINILKGLLDNREALINVDNCAVNKNHIIVAFGVMLVLNKIYDIVELHFLIAGHTKFSPDRMFAFISQLMKSKDIFGIEDILKIFEDHQRSKGATAQKSYTVESLEEFTNNKCNNFFDYKELLEDLVDKIKGFNSFHRFRARRENSLVILEVKEFSTDYTWKVLQIIGKTKFSANKKLVKVQMSEAKRADLIKQQRFIPSGRFTFLDP